MTRQLDNRLRRERVAGIALAIVGVGVLVIAVIALRSPNGHGKVAAEGTTATKSAAKSAAKSAPKSTFTSVPARTPSAPTSEPPATRLPLVVLNNTTIVGLADQAKARFQAGGWTVTSTDTLTNDIASTCAYFDPSVAGAEATARALQAQFPTIKRVAPKFAELPPGPVVVVLTSDYS
ncbi:MAG: LytR C-terminal domain-containing protein [Actinomycetota bacterium]|nr:LytR C-terminal domain-containing protein [Actinomycetota bacterium]